ncbi:uncharacterized protein K489DRAFT_376173 [Dissoconium aciculare CBS 342.82]|jgi:hypothetical protein|uniref:Uncharacterized protein n=1 Tax=Dissoconium aciculare CBS 342.82 TaxID=1314786 RepID=A0A6J3MFY2_9PEZI|nr:uncharacterized protein K489DRAFT_376173 [Dissoconium aciculare CBS 342.82]KAF1825792.1 hypothetical protein K489DRAFT_376173 [Dissoconium aciculare CBS 342.82]
MTGNVGVLHQGKSNTQHFGRTSRTNTRTKKKVNLRKTRLPANTPPPAHNEVVPSPGALGVSPVISPSILPKKRMWHMSRMPIHTGPDPRPSQWCGPWTSLDNAKVPFESVLGDMLVLGGRVPPCKFHGERCTVGRGVVREIVLIGGVIRVFEYTERPPVIISSPSRTRWEQAKGHNIGGFATVLYTV